MIEEQLLEVKTKIKQIEGVLHRRKEKLSEWNLDYKLVIAQKSNKAYYLQKSCGPRIDYKQLKPEEYKQTKLKLTKQVSQSRIKIKKFYNQLKDLDILQKQKNKVRLVCLNKKQNNKQNSQSKVQILKNLKNNQKQKNSSTQNTNMILCRTVKDRINPFLNIKGDKFIEISQQANANNENVGPKIMKYFGVGLETTSLGTTLKKQEKNDISKVGCIDKKKCLYNKTCSSNFGRKFSQAFNKNQKVFATSYQPRNIFQDRMKKILQYHGQFWKDQLKIN